MNHRQWLIQKQFLNDEGKVIGRLKSVYDQSMKDINGKIAVLDARIDVLQKAYNDIDGDDIGDLAKAVLGSRKKFTPEEAKATLQSMIQSKVYQKTYQQALEKQVGDILGKMHAQQFQIISEYLDECYENGFVGTMFDLQGQGIPLCFPLDQEQMVRAVQLDSKISEGLYTRLGQDIPVLKKRITAEVSRGISSGMRWEQVARQLSGKTGIGYTNAVRIARTEGHRIQCQAGMDACHKAIDMGADVVKQWDSTLDGKTRDSHAALDGEVREIDEKFSNGLMFPGDPNGIAAEVINCRCALLQRSRAALGDGFTKWNNFSKQLETFDSPKEYTEFKKGFFSKENKSYMNYVDKMSTKYGTRDFATVLDAMTDREYKHYSRLLKRNPIYNEKATATPAVQKPAKKVDPYEFTDDQSEAISWYVSGDGQFINQYHRGRVGADFGELSEEEKALSALLDEATDRDLPDDIKTLYRSVDASAIFGDIDAGDWYDIEAALLYGDQYSMKKVGKLIEKTKGATITEKGFMSTTKDYDLAAEWGGFTGAEKPVTIIFDEIPPGTKGADLKRFDIEGDEQREVLLARGVQYEIEDIFAQNGTVHVKAKIKKPK